MENDNKAVEWIQNQHHLPRNLMAVITKNLRTKDDLVKEAVRNLVEVYAEEIKGFEADFCIGADGKIDYPNSNPSFVWPELLGRATTNGLKAWLLAQWDKEKDLFSGIDVLFIEPDITGTKVVDCWECINMTFQRVSTEAPVRDLSVNRFPCPRLYVQFESEDTVRGNDVCDKAIDWLKKMNEVAANPYTSAEGQNQQ